MPPAARLSDTTTHGTPLMPGPGAVTVLIGGLPAWRTMIDQHICPAVSITGADGVGSVMIGSPTVLINNQMACRVGDIVVEKPGLALGPVNPIILGCMTVMIGEVGAVGPVSMALALSLIDIDGTANQQDKLLVALELTKLPPYILEKLKEKGTRVVVCRGSVTEHLTHLRGVHPRGWPPGKTWDAVPGLHSPSRNEVVIATIGHPGDPHVPKSGEGHGSHNLVVHEVSHAYDHATNGSASTAFNDARNSDINTLSAYETQPGAAGQEESFAESSARYFGGDASDAQTHPKLHEYWDARSTQEVQPADPKSGQP
jgi:uncharacterized Zn-binding protein involved in type VI secretion